MGQNRSAVEPGARVEPVALALLVVWVLLALGVTQVLSFR